MLRILLALLAFTCPVCQAGEAERAVASLDATKTLLPLRQIAGVSEYRLSNGLQVLLAPNDLHTRTYVNTVVRVGSVHEGAGEGGMAHLLEHMVFKGSPFSENPMADFDKYKLQWNGTTNVDRTNYFASFNPNALTLAWYLNWLSNALTRSFIRQADLDKEMTVVRNEFERSASSTYAHINQARMALAFPSHGYGRPTIGNRSDIENLSIDRLQQFYKNWYRPDNMTLIISGRFDVPITLQQIELSFGALSKPASALPTHYTQQAPQEGLRTARIERVGGSPMLVLGWRGVANLHPEHAALDAIAYTLSHTAGGRLPKALQENNIQAQAWASHSGLSQYGLFDVGVQLTDAAQVQSTRALIESQVQTILNDGITSAELQSIQKAAQSYTAGLSQSAESMGRALAEAVAVGDWRMPWWYLSQVQALTTDKVKAAANAHLVSSNRVEVVYSPTKAPQRAPETSPVAIGEFKPDLQALGLVKPLGEDLLNLPAIEPTREALDANTLYSSLPSGTLTALLPRPSANQQIAGQLDLNWGKLESMSGLGAEQYVGAVLLLGTREMGRQAIQDALTAINSSVYFQSSFSGLRLRFSTQAPHWPAFVKILQELLRNNLLQDCGQTRTQHSHSERMKDFEREFTQWQQQQVTRFRSQLDNPEQQGLNAMERKLYPYPAKHPRQIQSLADNLKRWQDLKLTDLCNTWQRFAGASQSEFAAVGHMDVELVKKDMTQILSGWASPIGADYARIAIQYFDIESHVQTVLTPDKPNASYRAERQLAIPHYSRQSWALALANHILGGSNHSHLMQRLREEAGLSYSVSSSLRSSEDNVLHFSMQATFAATVRDRFEETLGQALTQLQTQGISPEQLVQAKDYFEESSLTSRASNAGLASLFVGNMRHGRTLQFQVEQNAVLQSITLDEVNAALKTLLEEKGWVRLWSGDFKQNVNPSTKDKASAPPN